MNDRPQNKSLLLCSTPYCRNFKADGRSKCNKCRKRLWREKHPLYYLYDNLRTHAKTRGKGFELTFKEFEDFCAKTQYHILKGRGKDSLTIDRKENYLPYRADNIRVLTNGENASKGQWAEPSQYEEELVSAESYPF